MSFNEQFIESWLRAQIAQPETDPTYVRSWYKYALECLTWSHLKQSDAWEFCKVARKVGQKINREYGGLDIIRLHFPGIYENSKDKWSAI